MAVALMPDALCLWEVIEPLLLLVLPQPKGGRPRISDRACLLGILFVSRSPGRCRHKRWARVRHDMLEAVVRLAAVGVSDLIHLMLLNWLSRYGQIDWSRAVMDSCSGRAVFGGTHGPQSYG